MTDDITFCMSETCKNKKCFRHHSNIQDRTIPHSFSMFENTDTCPLYTKEMTLDEAIKHCKEKAEELREYSDVLSETSTTPKGKEISDCLECAEEHEQLAEWLEELKARREVDNGKNRTDT